MSCPAPLPIAATLAVLLRLLALLGLVSCCSAEEVVSIGVPTYSAEEQSPMAMPDSEELRCDACGLIVQNIAGAFLQAESLKTRPLREYQLDATLEDLCSKGLEGYETQQHDGKMRITVPGRELNATQGAIDGHVIRSSGDLIHHRLHSSCRHVMGEIGEEELYAMFQRHVAAIPRSYGLHVAIAASKSEAGAKNFTREICLTQDDGKTGRKKRKKRKKSTQNIAHSCSEELFFFAEAGWAQVLLKRRKERPRLEL